MKLMRIVLALMLLSVNASAEDEEPSWPCWRGPDGNNHAPESTDAPIRWNLRTGHNVLWKTPIPGRGHSSPVIANDGIFLTTCEVEKQTQSVLRFDRDSGRLTDQWIVHKGTLPAQIHENNSYATPTPVFDGENLVVAFESDNAIWATSISTSGFVVWRQRVCSYIPSTHQYGYAASPLVEEDLIIVAAEYDGRDSGIYALDRATGRQVWKIPRPQYLNFASPIIATIAGQRQLMLAGANSVVAYDPRSGRKLWDIDSATELICGTIVWDRRHVIISGGHPKRGTWCVSGDGSQVPLWENEVMCYEQSLLTIENYVFGVADTGVAYCWKARDGGEMWRKRLFAGPISASPLLADNRIYVASQRGNVYVIGASPNRCDVLAENFSGNSIFASPVAIDDRIYIRAGVQADGRRQEYLFAAGRTGVSGNR